MLDKLKQHFGYKIVLWNDELDHEEYKWFKTPDNLTVGFPIDQLSVNELSLIKIFLTPITITKKRYFRSNEERTWSDILFEPENVVTPLETDSTPYRYIHINIKGELTDLDVLTEAIASLFSTKTVILWESDTQGVIIDLQPDITDSIENLYDSITNTITSDFYIDLSLYIGLKNSMINEAKRHFVWEKICFSIVSQSHRMNVYNGEAVIPYLLLHETSSSTLQQISEQLLSNVINDKDLIKSIKMYLDCNMNISLAAKKLYLHRNTMQYRVEKFIEKTGIDIRHFSHAVSIYLALLINDSKK
ncbi:PucR family transcriptional regulator [Halalkalibacter nanhaiisediminis]|uniref:PucR-like helix-turn-helix protein n=1 Tax=Halalkalibacter nanhaiisediminis TaxID=688079 RepID=A0A562QGP5_9BACI|nr:helix-turn-helix domain-containing protein [Halalkalibacter nanhaiisediminis]TWI55911.1 PucR-like helix-turn-helix protein [Halalkalibacter nanhaiisediminis]